MAPAGRTFQRAGVRRPLEDESAVAGAAGDALAVEVFEQGDGVLARDAGDLLEPGHVYQAVGRARVGVVAQRGRQAFERLAVEEQVFLDADERARVEQELEEFAQVFAPGRGPARAR